MSDTQDEIRELRKKTASLRLSLDRMTTAHSEAKAKLAAAVRELQNIANATPRKWTAYDGTAERNKEFVLWAQNRARAAIDEATKDE